MLHSCKRCGGKYVGTSGYCSSDCSMAVAGSEGGKGIVALIKLIFLLSGPVVIWQTYEGQIPWYGYPVGILLFLVFAKALGNK
jgi:hypothetical protein